MTWLLRLLLSLVLLTFPVVAVAKPDDGGTGGLFIRMEGGLLTVKATDVPHRLILEGLAKRLGFELIVAGTLDERRSLELHGKRWEETLKKALSPASWVFVYEPTVGGSRLAKVFVFPLKQEKSSTPGSPPSPARATPAPSRVPAEASGKKVPLTPDQQEGVGAVLTQLLDAEDEETRAIALFGLAAMGGDQATQALREALQDEEPWIREVAVEALAELGGEQAIQGLKQALQDKDEDVQQAAQEALERLMQGSK